MLTLGNLFAPIVNPTRNIGAVARVLVADTRDELKDAIESGFQNDQSRLSIAGICRDCYDGNFAPYIAEWLGSDRARESAVRFSMIMRRTADVLSTHLYRKGPTREIYGYPVATEMLNSVYKANNFDSIMQMADRTTYINDVAAIEFLPNDGIDAYRVPVKMRLWDSSEFVPVFTSDESLEPWCVATLSNFGPKRVARVFTAEDVCKYSSPTPMVQSTQNVATTTAQGMKEEFGYPQPNYLGTVPFEFVHFELPRNSFWVSGVGQQLAHLNLHVNRRLSDIADQITHWRPKGILKNVKADWNLPRDQKPGQYTRLETTDNMMMNGKDAIADFLAPDLSFTTYDWNDLTAYIDHIVEMLGVPASTIRMEQQGGTSGVAIMSEQLPLIERAEARQRQFEYFERRIAKKCLTVCLAQLMNAQPQDEAGAFYVENQIAEIQAALADFDTSFRMIWPVMTKNRPGPERDAHDSFQLNFNLKSRAEMIADDLNIPIDEAFAKVQQTMQLIQQENAMLAAAQAPLAPPMPPEQPQEGEGDAQAESE
jgi:hypothetical protein